MKEVFIIIESDLANSKNSFVIKFMSANFTVIKKEFAVNYKKYAGSTSNNLHLCSYTPSEFCRDVFDVLTIIKSAKKSITFSKLKEDRIENVTLIGFETFLKEQIYIELTDGGRFTIAQGTSTNLIRIADKLALEYLKNPHSINLTIEL